MPDQPNPGMPTYTINITSDPDETTEDQELSPRLTVVAADENYPFLGTYHATAVLVDDKGVPAHDALTGEHMVQGIVSSDMKQVTFNWGRLSISRRGVFMFKVTVNRLEPSRAVFMGSIYSRAIRVKAARRGSQVDSWIKAARARRGSVGQRKA